MRVAPEIGIAVGGTAVGAAGIWVFEGAAVGTAVGGIGVLVAGAAVAAPEPGVSVTAGTVGTLVEVPWIGGTADSMAERVGLRVGWPDGLGKEQATLITKTTNTVTYEKIVCFIVLPMLVYSFL